MAASQLPSGTCFVSHSYRDSQYIPDLLKLLPSDVSALVFAPVEAGPDEMVSEALIPAILSCSSLVHLDTESSIASFWVAFEVDFARRSGIPVYVYNPTRGIIRPSIHSALDLIISDDRSFEDVIQPRSREITKRVRELLRRRNLHTANSHDSVRERAGCLLVFWSAEYAYDLTHPRPDLTPGNWRSRWLLRAVDDDFSNRVVFACIDDTPIPPDLAEKVLAVKIVVDGDISLHHVDDMIVKLYWLMWRHQAATLRKRRLAYRLANQLSPRQWIIFAILTLLPTSLGVSAYVSYQCGADSVANWFLVAALGTALSGGILWTEKFGPRQRGASGGDSTAT